MTTVWLAYNRKGKIEYFRTRSGLEVDFIVTIKNVTWAIEAKSGEINESELKALRTFSQLTSGSIKCMAVGLKETHTRKSKGTDMQLANDAC